MRDPVALFDALRWYETAAGEAKAERAHLETLREAYEIAKRKVEVQEGTVARYEDDARKKRDEYLALLRATEPTP